MGRNPRVISASLRARSRRRCSGPVKHGQSRAGRLRPSGGGLLPVGGAPTRRWGGGGGRHLFRALGGAAELSFLGKALGMPVQIVEGPSLPDEEEAAEQDGGSGIEVRLPEDTDSGIDKALEKVSEARRILSETVPPPSLEQS